jgi:hypothetical protein
MIMAALDNAVNGRQLQRWYAADPIAQVDRQYLQVETMSLTGDGH